MSDSTIEPLDDDSLAHTKRVLASPDDEIADGDPAFLRRLVATIDARDKTIAEQKEVEDRHHALLDEHLTRAAERDAEILRLREEAERAVETIAALNSALDEKRATIDAAAVTMARLRAEVSAMRDRCQSAVSALRGQMPTCTLAGDAWDEAIEAARIEIARLPLTAC